MIEQHPIPPVITPRSRILILGSFPSVRSRQQMFFYAHPQNRFWQVLAAVLGEPTPGAVSEKLDLLHRSDIALWDVIASCEIRGSADSAIRRVTPNPIPDLLGQAPIRHIFANGKTAWSLYRRYILPLVGIEAVCLPSTSPANAAWSREDLIREWSLRLRPALFPSACEGEK